MRGFSYQDWSNWKSYKRFLETFSFDFTVYGFTIFSVIISQEKKTAEVKILNWVYQMEWWETKEE